MPVSTPGPDDAPSDAEAPTAAADELEDTCGELVFGYDEDGPTAYPCGAPLRYTETGYDCAKGHSYTYAEHRHAQGWDYASDQVEARLLAQVGVVGVRPDDSRPWL
ncbi:hypothetical protein ACWGQ5_55170 [Streptomyces sp. NPDC055722]